MKIYYFAHNAKAPSARYRGTYILDKLNEFYGIDYKVYYPKKKDFLLLLILFFKLVFLSDKKNIFIFQKISYGKDRRYLKRRYLDVLKFILSKVKNSVYDIDDAMYETDNKQTVNFFISNCKKIITGSEYLKNYCEKYNSQIKFITTGIPRPNKFKLLKNNIFTLGWIGIYRVHRENLMDILFPSLKKIQFNFVFYILGVQTDDQEQEIRKYFNKNKNIKLEIVREVNWESEDEINSHICNFDIGVMPLIDNEINKSKSAFKLKQYLACGVSVLSSPVGENLRVVKSGKNGYLCYEETDWVEKINFFQKIAPDVYKEYVEKIIKDFDSCDYNLDNCAESLFDFIKK